MHAKMINGEISVYECCYECGHDVRVHFDVDDTQEFFKNVIAGKDTSYAKVDAFASCNDCNCGCEMDWFDGVEDLPEILTNLVPEYPTAKMIRK